MAIVKELIRTQADGTISFGNHELEQKAKVDEFINEGNKYKVKTFRTMTKLEKNDMFLYESVPGTSVNNFAETDGEVSFMVEGSLDAQIIVGLSEGTEYEVFIDGESVGKMSTKLGGKLTLSVELEKAEQVEVRIVK